MMGIGSAVSIAAAGVQEGVAAADAVDATQDAIVKAELKKISRKIEQHQMVAAMGDGISSDAKKAVERMAQS